MQVTWRHPTRLIPLGFLSLILLGTLLLMLPWARAGEGHAPFITALFTAVSAACVTGLAIVDTGSYWSGFGQVVILLLIQLGGLGIMTGATLLALLISPGLGLKTQLLAQAETRCDGLGDTRPVLMLILKVTVAVEVLLAAWLTLRLATAHGVDWPHALWSGIFHSISAFNNAGFSLYPDGLVRVNADQLLLGAVSLAIILGGIGFPVLQELRRDRWHWQRWSVHTRITLLGSALLLGVGMLLFLLWEWHNPDTLASMSLADKLGNAAFLSVSARTAGFNTVDIGQLHQGSLAFHYLLMFVGGGSAGTAGGIKVTTFFLLAMVVLAQVRGTRDVNVHGRRIGSDLQRQALTVALLGLAAVMIGLLLILGVTTLPLGAVLFEVISAFGTVGLSTGITAQLPASAHGVLIALMFLGRVGTITVATALAMRRYHVAYRYPEERPIVG